jgi:hypothetical protein
MRTQRQRVRPELYRMIVFTPFQPRMTPLGSAEVQKALDKCTLFRYSCKNYGQVSHELTFHASALSYACLRSNRLGGGLTLRATHVTWQKSYSTDG